MTASVLYDAPGPAARRRHAIIGVLGTIVLLSIPGFVVYRLGQAGQFAPRMWEWITYINIQHLLLGALMNTLKVFAVAALTSMLFGAVFAVGRLSEHRPVRMVATTVVEISRAVPMLVVIFILYYGLAASTSIELSAFWSLIAGLTLYNGSVLAEVFRGGILALPRGQGEAAYALGLSKHHVMRSVLLPQAVRSMFPALLFQLVVVLKEVSIGFIILYPELLYQARLLGGQGQLGAPMVPVAMVIAAVYISLSLAMSGVAKMVERRMNRQPGARSDTVSPGVAGHRTSSAAADVSSTALRT